MTETDIDLLTWVALHAAEVRFEDGMAGVIASALEDGPRGRPDWWIVTDLVNPIAAFLKRRYPKLPQPAEIQTKLDYGKRVGESAREWFRQLPGFVSVEGRVDGANVGWPRLRGKIDFRIGRGMIEFKTTKFLHDNPASVIENTPQDWEQLLLYAILSERKADEHRLVYFNDDDHDHPFRVFKTQILRDGPVEQYFRARLGALEYAHKQDNPQTLGRCRYYDTGCVFSAAGKCGCADKVKIGTSELVANVRIERDESYEATLAAVRDTPLTSRTKGITVWDLFTPRRAFRKLNGESKSFRPDENFEWRRFQEESFITSDLSGGTFDLTLPDRGEAGVPMIGRGIGIRFRESTADGFKETVLPILVRVSRGQPPPDPRQIGDAYKAQLGAICAMRGSPRGMVVVTYPNAQDAMQCYLVRFDNLGEIRERINDCVASIRVALKRTDVAMLPKCPEWLRERCGDDCLCQAPPGSRHGS